MEQCHWRIQEVAAGATPVPQASRFFRFYILIFHDVAASDLGAPPPSAGSEPHLWEILDPPLNAMVSFGFRICPGLRALRVQKYNQIVYLSSPGCLS